VTLNGSLLERTQRAIVAVFDREELRRFVRFELDEKFEVIVRDDNLRVQAYELLLWAGRHGREQELLDKLLAERRNETDFAAIAEALRMGELLVPPGSLYASLPTYGRVPLQKPLRVQNFTGRDLELARVLAYLEPGKILALCGPAGICKTAIAAEAIWRLAPGDDLPDRFPDGVIFHSFYHQKQASFALEAIARAYDVDPRLSPLDAARNALVRKKALLILDGTEEADDLSTVLSVAGTCGVLITTRRRSDSPTEMQDIAPLMEDQSVQLLRAWAGNYATDDDSTKYVVKLLGGLPLALYLVGSYLTSRRQKVQEYGAWLDGQGLAALHFDERPSKSVPLLLQRSLEQVSEQAQAAFGTVGILALAPFEAVIVAAALNVNLGAANHALGELVDYGLLLRPDDNYLATHALAHNYARTQVAPNTDMINRLALHYAALAEAESIKGLAGFTVLDSQRAHIVAVQAAALKAKQWNAVRQITWKLEHYLDLLGYSTDRLIVVQAGLAAARASTARYDEAEFLNRLGIANADLGDPRRAVEFYEQALEIVRETGDRSVEGAALGNLGAAYYALGDPRRAVDFYEKQLVVVREIGDRRGEANALNNLGMALKNLGEPHRAIALHEQALAVVREIGDRRGEGNALSNLGAAFYDLGEVRRAVELYDEQLAIVREIGDRRGEGNALGGLGVAYAVLGEVHRAVELYEQQLAIVQEIGDRRGEGNALNNLGVAHAILGEERRAIELHEQQLAIVREIGDRRGEGSALGNLGSRYAVLGEKRRAIELYEQQLVIAREIGDRRGEGNALNYLGAAYYDLGEVHHAIQWHEQALAILREIGDRRGEGAALGNLGNRYAGLGELRRAIELYEQVLIIMREIGDRRGEALTCWNLGLAYERVGDLARAASNLEISVAYEFAVGYPDADQDAQRVADLKKRAGL
jgi:tetratricopeptide (TPR) repeat protein